MELIFQFAVRFAVQTNSHYPPNGYSPAVRVANLAFHRHLPPEIHFRVANKSVIPNLPPKSTVTVRRTAIDPPFGWQIWLFTVICHPKSTFVWQTNP